jgi:hypothetical protein
LKSARDLLNGTGHYGLRVVATSSDRATLERLTLNSTEAFYCATLEDLSLLGAERLTD